jgi:hypothetical protein
VIRTLRLAPLLLAVFPSAVFASGCPRAPAIVETPMLAPSAALAAIEAGPLVTSSEAGVFVVRGRPTERDIPFRTGDVWSGMYYCPQGNTEVDLEIQEVNGHDVSAIFSFRHAPTATSGHFELSGTYQVSGKRLKLEAGDWVGIQPVGYTAVDLEGNVDASNVVFTGRVLSPGCGPFSVRRR